MEIIHRLPFFLCCKRPQKLHCPQAFLCGRFCAVAYLSAKFTGAELVIVLRVSLGGCGFLLCASAGIRCGAFRGGCGFLLGIGHLDHPLFASDTVKKP